MTPGVGKEEEPVLEPRGGHSKLAGALQRALQPPCRPSKCHKPPARLSCIHPLCCLPPACSDAIRRCRVRGSQGSRRR